MSRIAFGILRHFVGAIGGEALALHHQGLGVAILGTVVALSIADKFLDRSQGGTHERS